MASTVARLGCRAFGVVEQGDLVDQHGLADLDVPAG